MDKAKQYLFDGVNKHNRTNPDLQFKEMKILFKKPYTVLSLNCKSNLKYIEDLKVLASSLSLQVNYNHCNLISHRQHSIEKVCTRSQKESDPIQFQFREM